MAVTTTIERSGRAVREILADLSPAEADLFHREYRDALTKAAETFDLTEAESVLTRWWGIAHIRANPLTDDEQQLVERMRAGDDVGWSSPTARLAARGSAPS